MPGRREHGVGEIAGAVDRHALIGALVQPLEVGSASVSLTRNAWPIEGHDHQGTAGPPDAAGR